MYNAFCCPYCMKKLKKRFLREEYFCRDHSNIMQVKNGMYYIHRFDEAWEKCEKEKQGWIELNKSIGLYVDNQDHYFLPDGKPHLKDFFGAAKKGIDIILQNEDLNNKTCLDLGAGYGWAECYILKKVKCNLIALECNDDALIGLGRANVLKSYHKCDFISLIGDMHHLPLMDNSIDVIFTCGSLHHFRNMQQVLNQAYRVLKRGGRFWGVNEPHRPEEENESSFLAKYDLPELKYGIIERRPTISEYLEFGKALSLEVFMEEPFVLSGIKQ